MPMSSSSIGRSLFEPRSPRNEIVHVLSRSKAIRLRTKLMVLLYASLRFTASLVAISFSSREVSGDAPPLQLKIAGVNVPFSTTTMRLLYSRFL